VDFPATTYFGVWHLAFSRNQICILQILSILSKISVSNLAASFHAPINATTPAHLQILETIPQPAGAQTVA
jgi:hypothetical protein